MLIFNTGLGLTGFREIAGWDIKILLGMVALVCHLISLSQVEKIFFDDAPFIAQAQNKPTETEMGIKLHDVPQDRFAADLDHGFGFVLRFLPQTGSHAATEDYNGDWVY